MSKKRNRIVVLGAVMLSSVLAAGAALHFGWLVPRLFDIRLAVDFGPAGRPAFEEQMPIERGTTPKEAVSQVFAVRSGKSCCSLREVLEIGGVAIDPAQNRWWICSVNGDRKWVTAYGTRLKPGDVVEWRYIQDAQ